jgi:protein disulfide-isomerase A6
MWRSWRLGGGLLLLLAAAVTAVRETKYYDYLGISPDADDRTIQKAYRRAAL